MLDQRLQQKLGLKFSPQQIQLMKLLQVPTANLEQRIKEELESNPALEEGESDDDQIVTPDETPTDEPTVEEPMESEAEQEAQGGRVEGG
jgi:RNA polymerase sigma-54 factor